MLDVVIAIRDEIPRLGIEAALEAAPGVRLAASVHDLAGIHDALRAHAPRVLLLDVRFRSEDPALVPDIVRRFPACNVLMYVAHTAHQCAIRHLLSVGGRAKLSPSALRRIDECCLTSLRTQARGCLPSEASTDDLLRAIAAVAAGQVVASPWIDAFTDVARASDPQRPAITARELEVMALLARGLGNKAIARELGIREKTVKNHTGRLMAKLGLSSRAQVGVVAARHNLRVTPPGADA